VPDPVDRERERASWNHFTRLWHQQITIGKERRVETPARPGAKPVVKLAKDGRWTTKVQTWTRARDGAADLEATALAVIALSNHAPVLADEAAAWIDEQRKLWIWRLSELDRIMKEGTDG